MTCPPDAITGFFEFSGIDWCHGANHHYDFIAQPDPIPEDPWKYYAQDPAWPPGNYISFHLYQTPVPKLWVRCEYWDMPWSECGEAVADDLPIIWCRHQALTVDVWDIISPGLSSHLEVHW